MFVTEDLHKDGKLAWDDSVVDPDRAAYSTPHWKSGDMLGSQAADLHEIQASGRLTQYLSLCSMREPKFEYICQPFLFKVCKIVIARRHAAV